jgi:hypothetical protein
MSSYDGPEFVAAARNQVYSPKKAGAGRICDLRALIAIILIV